jgi:hypothetical protein
VFFGALYRLQMKALQSSLNDSEHPETTSNPKYGLNAGQIVCVQSVWSRSLHSTVELGCNILCRYVCVLITEEYNVIVNSEELTGTTEHTT